jgi:hypothetical protein
LLCFLPGPAVISVFGRPLAAGGRQNVTRREWLRQRKAIG